MNKTIVLVANSSWYMYNFRASTIRSLINSNHKVVCCVPDLDFESELIEAGATIKKFYMKSASTHIFYELYSFLALFFLFLQIKPDFVFTFTPKPNIYCGLMCSLLRIRYVINISGFGVAIKHKNRLLRFLVVQLYLLVCKKSVHVFVQNSSDYDFLFAKLGNSSVSIEILPGSGVDLDKFSHAPLPKDGTFTFGIFARLIEEKGLRKVVNAVHILRQKQVPDFKIIVAGSTAFDRSNGITKADLDGWIAGGVIDYVGNLSDVRSSLSRCHCVLLPTSYPEGTPKSLIEAASMGRLIITSRQPGCGDVVADKCGIVLQNNAVEDLVAAMEEVLVLTRDQLSRASFGAREHIVSNYDEKIVIAKYHEVLDY